MIKNFIALLLNVLALFKNNTSSPKLMVSQDVLTIEVGTPITTEILIRDYFRIESSLPAEINVLVDTYQDNYNQIGSYILVCQAMNSQKQVSSKEQLIIQVRDTIKPVIKLIKGGDTIVADHDLSEEEIKGLLQVEDNYDKALCSNQIEILKNTCDGTFNKKFNIELKISDSSNNETLQTFSYYLIQNPYSDIKIKDATPIQLDFTITSDVLQKNKLNDFTSIQPNQFTYIHLIDKASPLSLKQIFERYQSNFLTFQTDYLETKAETKNYPLYVTYHSLDGFEITWMDYIYVRETNPPSIIPKEIDVLIDLSNPPDESFYKDLFDITDNDKIIDIQFMQEPCSEDSFLLICQATDSSMNTSTAQILCHTYYSTKEMILPITLEVHQNTLSKQEILSMLLEEFTLPSGYLNLLLDTNYFYNKDGIYIVKVTLSFENDMQNIYFFKINLKNEPTEKKEDKTLFYVSISTFLLLFIVFLIIYHKRSSSF